MPTTTLHSILSQTKKQRSFTAMSIWEGFEGRFDDGHCMRVGIDASTWIFSATETGYQSRFSDIDNPELLELFQRLSSLVERAIIPFFVFGGPGSVAYLDGTRYIVSEDEQWLTGPFRELIESFGFFWFTAAGEPFSKLGWLNRHGYIDAIMTNDFEAFALGAQCILSERHDHNVNLVDIYDFDAITAHPQLCLGREGIFLLFILCGGHADTIGLRGCGARAAVMISRTRLAGSLFRAAISSSNENELQHFLCSWRNDLRTLLNMDPERELHGRLFPRIAQNITEDFPSVEIVWRYAEPFATKRPMTCSHPDILSFDSREPRLRDIAVTCERYFFWGFSGTLVHNLRTLLWPGFILRHFIQNALNIQPRLMHERPHRPVSVHCNFHKGNGDSQPVLEVVAMHVPAPVPDIDGPGILGYTIQMSSDSSLIDAISHGLTSFDISMPYAQACRTLSGPFACWIPEPVVDAAMPELVERFRAAHITEPEE